MTDSEEDQPKQEKEEKSLAKSEQVSPEKVPTKDESEVGEIVSEIEQMPPEVVRSFRSFMAMFTQSSGPRSHPLFEKFTEAHIDKYLDYVQRDDDHAYEYKKTNRWFYLAYAVMAIAAFMAGVVYLLPIDKDLLVQLIVILVTLAGGVGAGYGLSKKK
ncbi:MAG: hypothetical protein ACOYYU_16930 [Chloroflexota bacterium]